MPIYEYQCSTCSHRLEALQKMADAALVDCPACAQPALKKLVSAASFKLKGTGWYETDFKHNGRATGGEQAKPAGEAKPASVPKSAGESKPAGEAKPAGKKPASTNGSSVSA